MGIMQKLADRDGGEPRAEGIPSFEGMYRICPAGHRGFLITALKP